MKAESATKLVTQSETLSTLADELLLLYVNTCRLSSRYSKNIKEFFSNFKSNVIGNNKESNGREQIA